MEKNSRIYLAGHTGLVGSAIKRKLDEEECKLILRTHSELELRDQKATEIFFDEERPEYVIIAAARVGGIYPNTKYKAEFLYDNLQVQNNIINFSHKFKVKKLLFIGSNCMYPRECPQPIKEEYLLTGKLEPTNEAFAIAKIAGVKLCQYYKEQYGDNFISVVPANLFGPKDNFDLKNSHLVAALIRRFHESKLKNLEKVFLWGSGNPKREIMYVDNAASAIIFLMKNYNLKEIINIGSGEDKSIKEISRIIREIVGFQGEIIFDGKNPDGMNRKLLDSSKINAFGWKPEISMEEGLKRTYEWFLKDYRR